MSNNMMQKIDTVKIRETYVFFNQIALDKVIQALFTEKVLAVSLMSDIPLAPLLISNAVNEGFIFT